MESVFNGNKVLVVRLGKVHHEVLHSGRHVIRVSLAPFDRSAFRKLHKASYGSLWGQNSPILDYAAILEDTPTALE